MPPKFGPPRRVARFGVFEADLELGELRREGRPVPLQEHPLLVLAALLEQPGHEVSREELRRRLWPDQEFLDFQNGINTAVGRLRQTLGDSAENPRFIVTRRGHGYRFIAPVEWAPIRTPDEDLRAGVPASPAGSQRSTASRDWTWKARIWLLGAAGGILAAVGALLYWNGWQIAGLQSLGPSPSERVGRLLIYAPTGETLTGSFALSPSGTRLAFVTGGASPENSRLWLRSVDSVAAHPLAGTDGAAMPFWAPDERAIGFFAERKLKTIELDSGKILTIADAVRARGGSWSADGLILFAPDVNSPVLSIAAAGGWATPVTDLGDAPSHRFPFFMPDGRHYLYLVLREDRDQSEIRWGRLGSSEGGRLFAAGSHAAMADGYIFFARGPALLAQAFDAAKLQPIGLPFVVNESVGVYGEEGPTGLGLFSASSHAVALADLPRPALHLSWIDRHGRPLGVTGVSGDYKALDLSPDGMRAAVVRFDPRKRSSDLIVVDLRTGVQTQITDDPWPDANPVWAPRGDRLAFGSLREGRWSCLVRDPARPGEERRLPTVCNGPNSWFRDGKSLLCNTLGTTTAFWKVPIEPDHAPTPLVTGLGYAQGRLSPDGSWLAYSSDHEGRRQIYVLELGSAPAYSPVPLGAGDGPRWRGDGRELFFLSGRTLTSVSFSSGSQPQFGRPQPLFEAPLPPSDSLADFLTSFGVSPDGSKFLFATATTSEPRFAIHVQPHWTASRPR